MKIFQANSCLWPVVLITTLCDKFVNNLKSPGFLQVILFSYNKIEILSKVELNTHNRNVTNIYACCNIEGNMVPR
jgi:hypothetical protein